MTKYASIFMQPRQPDVKALAREIVDAFDSPVRPSSYAELSKIRNYYCKLRRPQWRLLFDTIAPSARIDISYWYTEKLRWRTGNCPEGKIVKMSAPEYRLAYAPLVDLVNTLCDVQGDLAHALNICRSRFLAGGYNGRRDMQWEDMSGIVTI